MKRSDVTDEHVLDLARAWQRREGVPVLDARERLRRAYSRPRT